jgi:PEP-CTERM motif
MMKHGLLCIATAVTVLLCGGASAQPVLLYDMEGSPPPSGFGPNGGIIVSQSTIGVTQGLNSMRIETTDGFDGAITPIVPAALANGVDSILYDLTINAGEEFAGGFADMGVTIFGCVAEGDCGHQAQFADFNSIGALTAGTYKNLQIDLAHAVNLAPGKSLKQILADGDLTAITHFQFFFNQTFDAPMIAYIDNIRAVVPEPATGMLFGLAAMAIGMVVRRRR